MYSFEWKIFSWCETVKDSAKEKSPAETKERCRKSRLSLVHTAKVCVHTPTHARGGDERQDKTSTAREEPEREGEPSSPPQQRLAEIHKSKMDELLVEVCGENGANYKGVVTDVYEDGVRVSFENDWQEESKFLFSQVRLPPADVVTTFSEMMEVEVFSRSNENEACGWWRAVIKMMKGDFFVVEYLGWDNSYTEIVSADRLRVKNTNPPINEKTFFRFEIEVPEDIREYSLLNSAKIDGVHREFQKAIGAAECRYVPERGTLLVISRSESTQRRANMIQEMCFRNLSQKVMLLKRTEEAARQLESTKLHNSGGNFTNNQRISAFIGQSLNDSLCGRRRECLLPAQGHRDGVHSEANQQPGRERCPR